ncbi:cob(I)alamin adenolsyltransferase/cobinamide ATP-dependent adenolsyltransferase [Marinobacterium nitratireducens]|uniref:Corrinoid adenosyltransferase n=1 Tax=Marinobacterium nitratireducens TaxID=518897 RepID=A0A918DSU5_9GAMM|nr:cob(I)yrinic acid a,c-diamide adenosyltransferase [Marinobacterium nitratireducens]GGO81448.1 cob(I)alamin adenolsyltransferase/cobinamide ATP-dependent adenolsyltransferase [Marinobacterium nitratireducens]
MSETEKHKSRMQRKKAVVDAAIARADEIRGIVLVLTGNGKGKSSSAFGMVARALGHDQQVGVVQFIKGAFSTGEEAFFRRLPAVRYHVMGEGFTWETQDRERDVQAAQAAFATACELMRDPAINLVVLDELNIALKYRYLEIDALIAALQARPAHQNVVITGRGAPAELIELADTVTEMGDVKHAFRAGVAAQPGIEL